MVGPEDGDAEVLLWCNPTDGESLDPATTTERSQSVLSRLSTESRFHFFLQDFLEGKPRRSELLRALPERSETPSTYRLPSRLAAEFLSKKDYIDNWGSEMNEEFCFWSFSQWKRALLETGFRIIEHATGSEPGSKVYCNPWIVENRFQNLVTLMKADGSQTPLEFPPTNMVLVAEKPAN